MKPSLLLSSPPFLSFLPLFFSTASLEGEHILLVPWYPKYDVLYLDSLSFSLLLEPSLVLIVFHHNLLESLQLFQFTIFHFLLLHCNLLLYFLNQELVELFFFFLFNFFTLRFIFHLLISHLFLKLNLALILLPFLFFTLVVGLRLFDL